MMPANIINRSLTNTEMASPVPIWTETAGLDYSGHSSGAVFFDFDNDGRLDLFLCNVGKYTTEEIGRGGYYVGFTNGFSGHLFPGRTEFSILYKNLGNNKFKDVTAE